jgi:hypothetical protein
MARSVGSRAIPPHPANLIRHPDGPVTLAPDQDHPSDHTDRGP